VGFLRQGLELKDLELATLLSQVCTTTPSTEGAL
jgi:hypothetical protein